MRIPPGCKARWRDSNGYDIYDLGDLGEFDGKGLRATKWGTKEELIEMADAASKCGIGEGRPKARWEQLPIYTASHDPQSRLREVHFGGQSLRSQNWSLGEERGRGVCRKRDLRSGGGSRKPCTLGAWGT